MKNTPLRRKVLAGWLAISLCLAGWLLPLAQPPGYAGAAVVTATTAVPLVTMTQRPNGCTVHVVGAGQTLWAIALAYGVKVDDIRALNGMGAGSTDIYPGETLVIRCMPLTPTLQASLTTSPAAGRPERTPTRTAVTYTRTAARSNTLAVAAPAASAQPAGEPGPPGALVAGLLILTGGTLVVLLVFGLLRKR